MKSLVINLNEGCCCGAGLNPKSRNEKEIAFDLGKKTFHLLDINRIRHNYKKKHLKETSCPLDLKLEERHASICYEQGVDDSSLISINKIKEEKKSRLSVYCQAVSRFRQRLSLQKDRSQNETGQNFQSNKHQLKKQKLRMTCVRNDLISLGGNNQHISKSCLKIYKQKKYPRSITKRYTLYQNMRAKDVNETRRQFQDSQYLHKVSFATSNQQLKGFDLTNSTSAQKAQLNHSTTYDQSMTSTVQDSRHHSIQIYLGNKSTSMTRQYQAECQESYQEQNSRRGRYAVLNRNQGSDLKFDKENDINAGNMQIAKLFNKRQRIPKNQYQAGQDNFTQPIVFRQSNDLSPFKKYSLQKGLVDLIHNPTKELLKAADITSQITTLQTQLNNLKHEQSLLKLRLSQQQSSFKQQYQILIRKKSQIQEAQQQREQQINQLKQIIHFTFNSSVLS